MGEVIRRTKAGRFVGFYLRFYEGGRRRVLASKQPTHAAARRMLLEIEARIARGHAGLPERVSSRLTVAELVDRYLQAGSRPRLKDVEAYRSVTRSVLKKVLVHLGRLSTETITKGDVAKARDLLCRGHADGTVRTALARLSAVFSWGVREGLVPSNPCRGVERPRPAATLDFFSRAEVQQLLDASKERASTSAGRMLHVAIALAAHTGLRKGELLGLRWTDLDLDTLRLTVARSYRTTPKGGRARHLRLPSRLVPLLKEWRSACPQSPESAVLPLGRGRLRVAGPAAMLGLPRLLRDLGMREVPHPWHLLRHTFASHFVMAGGNILALQKILGHSDVKMTLIYAHLAPDFLGQEMERITYER